MAISNDVTNRNEVMQNQNSRPQPDFSIAEARRIVRDLFEPNPAIYWSDFLGSLSLGAAAFLSSRLLVRFSSDWTIWWPAIAGMTIVAILAFYRAALFTHELTHLRQGQFRLFRVAWNSLVGIPFLMPSFLYQVHLLHHMRKHYATHQDGEYLPWARLPRWHIVWYLTQSLFIPALAVIRFGVLTPLSWFSPRFRRWLIRRASSMIVDPSFVRPTPTPQELRQWRMQEMGCFAIVWGAVLLTFAGVLLPTLFVHAYIIAVGIVLLNAIRTLGAHRYRLARHEVTFVEQLMDSVNYPDRAWLGELWAPVGLRFHALHHLFPSLPYHALAKAHRRLMRELPTDSPYRQTVSPSLWAALRTLWREAGRSKGQAQATDGLTITTSETNTPSPLDKAWNRTADRIRVESGKYAPRGNAFATDQQRNSL